MIYVVLFAALALSLGLYYIPAFLAKRRLWRQASDYLVSSQKTAPGVVSNSGVAYSFQLASLGPFFVLGFIGEFFPALLNIGFYAVGLFLIFVFRKRIALFICARRGADHSITVHGFLADAHGHSPRLRALASGLTIFALIGLVAGEAFGVAKVLGPLFGNDPNASFLVVAGLMFLMFVSSTNGGNDGVMRSDQTQLAVAYAGLFIALAAMLAFVVLRDSAKPATVFGAIVFIAAALTIFLRKKLVFIDWNAAAIPAGADGSDGKQRIAGFLRGMERNLNGLVVLACAVAMVAAVAIVWRSGVGAAPVLALVTTTTFSPAALTTLAVLPLVYQVVDISNWQRLAALRPDAPDDRSLTTALVGYCIEAPVVWLFLLCFGAVALSVVVAPADADPLHAFVEWLVQGQDPFANVVFVAFVTAVVAMALSTMDAVMLASQQAFRLDILPAAISDLTPKCRRDDDSEGIYRTSRFTVLVFCVAIGLLLAADYAASRGVLTFGSDTFLQVLMAFYSAQVAFVPLLVGGLVNAEGRHRYLSVTSREAAVVLLSGAATGIGVAIVSIVGGDTELGWLAIPVCLGLSTFLYALCCGRALMRGGLV